MVRVKRTLVALVQDRPGTLNRIASLFRRRAYNIESLTVGHTERYGVSRMTIVVDESGTSRGIVERNLRKLINVLHVEDVTDASAVMHDLALIKVETVNGTRAEIMKIAESFGARILDIGLDTLIVEATAPGDQIDRLVRILRPFGIAEMVRTGRIAMVRDIVSNPIQNEKERA